MRNSHVGNVAPKWRAKYAVPDETLVQKLCGALDNILEDTVLPDGFRNDLLQEFGRHVEFHTIGAKDIQNRQSQYLLSHGCFAAVTDCLGTYGEYEFYTIEEYAERGLSKVDHLGMVDNKRAVLIEAKSPSAMKAVGDSLPTDALKLDWYPTQSLVSNILLKAALHLGLREMEWLFLTIKDSSEPFRAFLGAILSVLDGAPVQASEFNPILEKGEGEDDIDDGSRGDAAEFDLIFTSSGATLFPNLSKYGYVSFAALTSHSFFHTVPRTETGNRRLWLTRHIGSGSTGSVWECRFDNSDDLFAIKVIELQRRSDVERQQRFL
ncbi:hypothetical protein EDB89DRAFT_2063410 [Lactarius sanguifluus]|nr:hypothetical protein EDB89DRAFT_2063410 [Lactarius sanguifluus]